MTKKFETRAAYLFYQDPRRRHFNAKCHHQSEFTMICPSSVPRDSGVERVPRDNLSGCKKTSTKSSGNTASNKVSGRSNGQQAGKRTCLAAAPMAAAGLLFVTHTLARCCLIVARRMGQPHAIANWMEYGILGPQIHGRGYYWLWYGHL